LAQISIPVWPNRGQFGIRAVGVSRCRDAIAELVGPSSNSVHFVPVLLFAYNTNPEDPNAVAITPIDAPKKLGHLPREVAFAYRHRMQQLGFDGPSACSAAISGGWVVDGRQYEYALELDLALADAPGFENPTIEPGSLPLWRRLTDVVPPSHAYRAWLRDPVEALGARMRVSSWVKPEWGSVRYYVEPRQGGGYGIKLLELDRSQHDAWFGTRDVEADLFDIEGRWATIYLDPIEVGQHSTRWARQGGHFTREFLILQEQLSAIYAAMSSTKDPELKLALACEGQQLQYTLEEKGRTRGPDGRTIKDAAGATWDLISQAYIGTIVRAHVAANRIEDAKTALEQFLVKAPHHGRSKPLIALVKKIEGAHR
jgi:hypothetical protein